MPILYSASPRVMVSADENRIRRMKEAEHSFYSVGLNINSVPSSHRFIHRPPHTPQSRINQPSHSLIPTNPSGLPQPLPPNLPSIPLIPFPPPSHDHLTAGSSPKVLGVIGTTVPDIIPQPACGVDEPDTRSLHGSCVGECWHGDIVIFKGELEHSKCPVGSVDGMDVVVLV